MAFCLEVPAVQTQQSNDWAQADVKLRQDWTRANHKFDVICRSKTGGNGVHAHRNPRCADAARVISQLNILINGVQACHKQSCSIAAYRVLWQTKRNLMQRYRKELRKKGLSLGVFNVIYDAGDPLRKISDSAIQKGLIGLSFAVKNLSEEVGKITPNLSGSEAQLRVKEIDSQAGAAFQDFLGLSLLIDASVSSFSPSGRVSLSEQRMANEIADSLVGLRDQLNALKKRLGLKPGKSITTRDIKSAIQIRKGIPLRSLNTGIPRAAIVGVGERKKSEAELLSMSRFSGKSFLDSRYAPSPYVPLMRREFTKTQLAEMADRGKVMRILYEHSSGASYTAGNPGGLSVLVHRQETGDCSIVADQEVLEAFHRVPQNAPRYWEQRLLIESKKQGFSSSDGGVFPKYMSDLLVENKLIVVKHYLQPKEKPEVFDSDLNAALLKGRLVIVALDAGVLWNRSTDLGDSHAVLVTGAEVMRGSGKVVGYYINDSGSLPAAGGRLVEASQFLSAVNSTSGGAFIEVL